VDRRGVPLDDSPRPSSIAKEASVGVTFRVAVGQRHDGASHLLRTEATSRLTEFFTIKKEKTAEQTEALRGHGVGALAVEECMLPIRNGDAGAKALQEERVRKGLGLDVCPPQAGERRDDNVSTPQTSDAVSPLLASRCVHKNVSPLNALAQRQRQV
jgi:hypothetical protein